MASYTRHIVRRLPGVACNPDCRYGKVYWKDQKVDRVPGGAAIAMVRIQPPPICWMGEAIDMVTLKGYQIAVVNGLWLKD